ncbi:MAG: helix-turn-helix transcriptional regulator [Phycisphaerae bacterium]
MANKSVVCRKLKGLLAENEMSVKKLSQIIGISENSLTLKVNGQRNWWFWEMVRTMKVFGYEEVREVFPELYEATLKVS